MSSPGHEQTPVGHSATPRPHQLPDALEAVREPSAAERSLTRVQRWVMSTLAVTTILHMSAGIIVAAMFLEEPGPGAETGLCIIAGGFGVMAVAAALGIHGRRILSGWLLLGFIPTVVGLWLVN